MRMWVAIDWMGGLGWGKKHRMGRGGEEGANHPVGTSPGEHDDACAFESENYRPPFAFFSPETPPRDDGSGGRAPKASATEGAGDFFEKSSAATCDLERFFKRTLADMSVWVFDLGLGVCEPQEAWAALVDR